MVRIATRVSGGAAAIAGAAYIAAMIAALADGDGGVEIPPSVRALWLAAVVVLGMVGITGWTVDRSAAAHAAELRAEFKAELAAHRAELLAALKEASLTNTSVVTGEVTATMERVGNNMMNRAYSRGYVEQHPFRGVAEVPTQVIVGSNVLKLREDL
jgi:hypothetical protein